MKSGVFRRVRPRLFTSVHGVSVVILWSRPASPNDIINETVVGPYFSRKYRDWETRCHTGSPFCLRKLLSNADAGTKRRSKLTCRAIFPAV